MKKQIIILMLVCLLVTPVMAAKSLQSIEAVDWKTDKLTITDSGIYNGKDLVKAPEHFSVIKSNIKRCQYVEESKKF
jgi:hypothetical protein